MIRIDHYHHVLPCKEAPWAEQIIDRVDLVLTKLETIMSTVEELEPLVAEILSVVGKVSADTEKLLADLAAIPTTGLTPEQQGIVDRTVSSLTDALGRLKALDSKVPDAAPAEPQA